MAANHYLKKTPWDKRTFNIETYEVVSEEEGALKETENRKGHFTLKADPHSPKGLLEAYGFYYVDTLLQPECKAVRLKSFEKEGIIITKEGDLDSILIIADEAFAHGRFHRDQNVPSPLADLRYVRWLKDLFHQDQVYFLYYQKELAGFIGYEGNKILLMGVSETYRGAGLSKPFLYTACRQLISEGHDKLITSISAINQASLNLFYSLGFRVRGAVDVYHKFNDEIEEE
ncbi:L-amino acid N-acyltransferase YncA [Halobacillus karajensis]|uniref:GNAT family N-acetyltransferase n=1 Tax=Halobacillus karajensis TaxID=195088 RepID=UPI0008A7F85D|nr:GNAT family N-acetyltransferase [Halobacillus karajensis]SEI02447.1 L-amino acid N-acyltransferase YncA [Halobacillus karajensis]